MFRAVYFFMAALCVAVMVCSCRAVENEAETELFEAAVDADDIPAEETEDSTNAKPRRYSKEFAGSGVSPRIYAGDYDGDGLKEYALVQMIGDGTGVYEEQLYILEKDGTDLNIVTRENRQLLNEVCSRISSEVSPDGGSLQLFADWEPLCSIVLDAGKKYEGFYLDEQIRICVNGTSEKADADGKSDSSAYSIEMVLIPGIAYEGARTLSYECSPEIKAEILYGSDGSIRTGGINKK